MLTKLDSNSNATHTKGEKITLRNAPFLYRVAALLLDGIFYLAILSIYLLVHSPFRIPSAFDFSLVYVLFLFLQIPFQLFTQSSIGEKIWQIKTSHRFWSPETDKPENSNRLSLFIRLIFWPFTSKQQMGIFGKIEIAKASSLTIAISTLSFALIDFSFLENPITARIEVEKTPILEVAGAERLPFFFTEALWPADFLGESVFYQVPYEKGPPFKHLSKVIVRWDAPDIQVTIEGPRTTLSKNERDIEGIKSCFTHGSTSVFNTDCLNIRRKVLTRHFEEATKSVGRFSAPEIKWFEIQNDYSNISSQGIWMKFNPNSEFQLKRQIRVVVFTATASMQSFILDYINTTSGEEAEKKFKNVIASLKIIQELNPARTLIDGEIASEIKNNQKGSRKLLNYWIAKMSIDPQNFENYFQTLQTIQAIRENHLGQAGQNYTFSPQLKNLFQNLMKYAYDTASAQGNTQEFNREEKLLEIQKIWSQFK